MNNTYPTDPRVRQSETLECNRDDSGPPNNTIKTTAKKFSEPITMFPPKHMNMNFVNSNTVTARVS